MKLINVLWRNQNRMGVVWCWDLHYQRFNLRNYLEPLLSIYFVISILHNVTVSPHLNLHNKLHHRWYESFRCMAVNSWFTFRVQCRRQYVMEILRNPPRKQLKYKKTVTQKPFTHNPVKIVFSTRKKEIMSAARNLTQTRTLSRIKIHDMFGRHGKNAP